MEQRDRYVVTDDQFPASLWHNLCFHKRAFFFFIGQFQASYGKPLLAARDPKCSAKDAEAGVLAMEALHKQVIPVSGVHLLRLLKFFFPLLHLFKTLW